MSSLIDLPVELFKQIRPSEGSVKTFIITDENTNNIPDHFGFRIVVGEPRNSGGQTKCQEIETEFLLKSWYLKYRRYNEFDIIGKKVYNDNILEMDVTIPCNTIQQVKKYLIKTSAGMYRLIGPPTITTNKSINIIFYNYWMISGGFPIKFNELISHYHRL